MSIGVAILNSGGSHGGGMSSASGTQLQIVGNVVCIQGDIYNCPIHGPNPVDTGCSTILDVNSKPVVINGSVANCGGIIDSNFAPYFGVAS